MYKCSTKMRKKNKIKNNNNKNTKKNEGEGAKVVGLVVERCDCAVLQEGLIGFQSCRGGPLGRTDGHIHLIRTIWAQTYRVRK